jgi:hypothetical protein
MNGRIFAYCERGLDPSFWAEPANAVTNAAFVIAGLATFHVIGERPPGERRVMHGALAALVVLIGVGSFLFHTYATPWAAIADVAPIGLFMLFYFAVTLRSLLRLPVGGAIALTAGFAACLWAAGRITCGPDGAVEFAGGGGGRCLNGSLGYLPALAAMLAIGGVLAVKRHPAARPLLAAGALFAVSVTFRSLDRALCADTAIAAYPLGTHFLWHTLNALVLFILLRAVILYSKPTRPLPFSNMFL